MAHRSTWSGSASDLLRAGATDVFPDDRAGAGLPVLKHWRAVYVARRHCFGLWGSKWPSAAKVDWGPALSGYQPIVSMRGIVGCPQTGLKLIRKGKLRTEKRAILVAIGDDTITLVGIINDFILV